MASTTHPTRRAALQALGLGSFAAAASLPAFADTFPSKPLRIIPFGVGGGPTDLLARVYGERLTQRWGQPIVVEPKPGAAGIIAADAVAKAAPDGYTVLLTLPLTHISNALLQAKLPYDPFKDFIPVSVLATGGPVLVARANAPYNTTKEFIEYAKKQAKGITYGTWGIGSTAHLLGELLKRQTGANLIHAAYKTEATAHNDLFGEVLDVAWANPATARGYIQSGRMKALALSGTRRLSALQGVSTFTEQGFPDFDFDSWLGVYLPARTPAPVVDAWAQALRDITLQPEISGRIVTLGFEPLGSTPAQFAERMKKDYQITAELIKAAGVTAQ